MNPVKSLEIILQEFYSGFLKAHIFDIYSSEYSGSTVHIQNSKGIVIHICALTWSLLLFAQYALTTHWAFTPPPLLHNVHELHIRSKETSSDSQYPFTLYYLICHNFAPIILTWRRLHLNWWQYDENTGKWNILTVNKRACRRLYVIPLFNKKRNLSTKTTYVRLYFYISSVKSNRRNLSRL